MLFLAAHLFDFGGDGVNFRVYSLLRSKGPPFIVCDECS